MARYRLTQYINDYVKIGDEYKHVEVECDYECSNWDDFENLLLTLVSNKDDIKIRIRTEEVTD